MGIPLVESYEKKLIEVFETLFEEIIKENPILNIRAKSRVGSEISDILEDKFVNYLQNNPHPFLTHPMKSPRGSTKNPYDATCTFNYLNHGEKVWIDFKAFKVSAADSNPDIGTINKVIKFIKEGNYYILFVFVFYDEHEERLKFVKRDGNYIKVYPLKNVSSTVRMNPKRQLQVNVSSEPEYRTREEFLVLLKKKHEESLKRTFEKTKKELSQLDELYEGLFFSNQKSEEMLTEELMTHKK